MLGYCEITKRCRFAELEGPGKVKVARNIEFIGHEMAMLNVRKANSGAEIKNPAVDVPFMNITPVPIVNVNERAVENHTERDSSFNEGTATVDPDSHHQTVSEKCESETTGSPKSLLHLNASPGTSNPHVSRKLLLMMWNL
jgi:hypothetical protein